MMFGFRDEFEYFECSKCGCLQISEFPESMEKYYPSNYYSYISNKSNPIKEFLKIQRDKYALYKRGLIGGLIYKKFPNLNLERLIKLKELSYQLKLDAEILDIGCGTGSSFLIPLKNLGFKRLYGVDPFISEDIVDNLVIYKKEITQLDNNKKFDIISSHHSLEHIPNQLETLNKISKILSRNGVCIIALPVKSEFIWKKYGIHWVQIDAPRHFFIHTVKSLTYLAEKVGLKLVHIYYDSTDFQFWGSEQYLRDIPLMSENSYAVNPKKSIFTKSQIKKYKEMAKKLNENRQGDQAVFYFVKK